MVKSSLRLIKKVYDECSAKEEIFKCFKIQGIKVMDKALRSKIIPITHGLSLVSNYREGRMLSANTPQINETKLQNLPSDDLNSILADTTSRFLESHRLQINFSKLANEEARKDDGFGGLGGGGKKGKGGNYALLWALGIKGTFLMMAYKGIAIMAGTALLVGKMALLLSAILGLKKLVNSGNEKTTFEIVKVPKYSESYSHSSSHEDDGHHYHRSIDLIRDFEHKVQNYNNIPLNSN